MKDISKLISVVKIGGSTVIQPFILARSPTSDRIIPFWLEYSTHSEPTREEITADPPVPRDQSLERYQSLLELRLPGVITYRATAQRPPKKCTYEIGVYKLPISGCMWTVLPSNYA